MNEREFQDPTPNHGQIGAGLFDFAYAENKKSRINWLSHMGKCLAAPPLLGYHTRVRVTPATQCRIESDPNANTKRVLWMARVWERAPVRRGPGVWILTPPTHPRTTTARRVSFLRVL